MSQNRFPFYQTFKTCCFLLAEMEAPSTQCFQDPLCAIEEKSEGMSALSLDKPPGIEPSTTRRSPTVIMNRQAADGSEDTENPADHDKNDATDGSSICSPGVRQPDISHYTLCTVDAFCFISCQFSRSSITKLWLKFQIENNFNLVR